MPEVENSSPISPEDALKALEARIAYAADGMRLMRKLADEKWDRRKGAGPYHDPGFGELSSVVEFAFLHRGLVEAWEIMTGGDWPEAVEPLRTEIR